MSPVVYLALARLGVIAVKASGSMVLAYRLEAFSPRELDWTGCGQVMTGSVRVPHEQSHETSDAVARLLVRLGRHCCTQWGALRSENRMSGQA